MVLDLKVLNFIVAWFIGSRISFSLQRCLVIYTCGAFIMTTPTFYAHLPRSAYFALHIGRITVTVLEVQQLKLDTLLRTFL